MEQLHDDFLVNKLTTYGDTLVNEFGSPTWDLNLDLLEMPELINTRKERFIILTYSKNDNYPNILYRRGLHTSSGVKIIDEFYVERFSPQQVSKEVQEWLRD